jgi:hypothetical protein
VSTLRTIIAFEDYVWLATYASLTDGEAGDPVQFSKHVSRTIQVSGTFGAGGTIIAEGSNDGTNWFALTEDGTAAISFTAAGGALIYEDPIHVRPRVSAGTGVNVKVTICGAG